MKILQIIDTLNPGGAERMAVNLVNSFDEIGIDNLLIVSRLDGGLRAGVVNQGKLIFLDKQSTFDFKAFHKLRRKVIEFKPDVIHAHGTSIYWAFALKFLHKGFRLIWHDHLGISAEVLTSNPRKELAFLATRMDHIITADESTRDHWIKVRLKPAEKISYLKNFPHLNISPHEVERPFTFLHLANYREEKGHLHLVEAVKLLKAEIETDFLVRMVGVSIDPKWKAKVQSLAVKYQLQDVLQVEGSHDDVSEILSEVDAGLIVSDREGLPVALLEYGLAGLQVISTKVGQCPEVLGHGKFGYLLNPGDISELADNMKILIQGDNEAKGKSISFRDHVQSNYGFQQFYDGYKVILTQLGVETERELEV